MTKSIMDGRSVRSFAAPSQASSANTEASLQEKMASWSAELLKRPPIIRRERLSPTLALQAMRTLPTRAGPSALQYSTPDVTSSQCLEGTSLPPAWSLFAFQPLDALHDLGPDGSSTVYSAPSPYSRRMWAGGKFEWPSASVRGGDAGAKIGDLVQETVSVASVDLKLDRGLVFVHQDRIWHRVEGDDDDGRASTSSPALLKERRSFVFRPGISQQTSTTSTKDTSTKSRKGSTSLAQTTPSNPLLSFTYTPTLPLLFRFSALTFNAHRIHYDVQWCREVEGHEAPVVHGPMTACLMAEIAVHWANKQGSEGMVLRSLDYRATAPMYIDRPIEFTMSHSEQSERNENEATILAIQDGKIGMRGTVTFDT